jgi:hypothetical protein
VPCPALGSREATLSSSEGATYDVANHGYRKGVKGGKRKLKKHHQGATTTTDHGDGNNGETDGSSGRHISTAAHNDKHQARPPTDHSKRLLEEACPNHEYPIRHKLKDCGIMRSLMTSWFLTWGAELDECPDGSDMTPFPGKMSP